MKLYVCYGTFWTLRPGGHPCRNAYRALRRAGYDPEVKRVYGGPFGPLRGTSGRREVRELTGQSWVPVLVTDGGQTIQDSARIIEWAERNPATTATTS